MVPESTRDAPCAARRVASAGSARARCTKVLLALTLSALAAVRASAECGSYKAPPPPAEDKDPPDGSVPPDSRDPADPPPPPEGGGGGTPPGGGGGGDRTGGGQPPAGGGPGGDTTRRSRPRNSVDVTNWTYWWYANRWSVLRLDPRADANRVRTGEAAPNDDAWRAEVHLTLSKAIGDFDDEVAAAAALALGRGGEPSDLPVLLALAKDEKRSREVRESALMAIGHLPSDTDSDRVAARRALEQVLADGSLQPRTRAMAGYALGLRRDAASMPALFDAARSSGSGWDVPAAGLAGLGLSGCPEARVELERLLRAPRRNADRETPRRVYAAQGLALLGDAAAVPALEAALGDEREEVRRAAALALGAVAPPSALSAQKTLRAMLEDDQDRGCRGAAAIALGRIGGPGAVDALERALDKGSATVETFAALGLGIHARIWSDDASVAVIRRAYPKARSDLRGALTVAAGLARMSEFARDIRDFAESGADPHVRAHAVFSLGLLGDHTGGAPVLRKLLREEPSRLVQGESALALGLLGDTKGVLTLADMVENGRTEHVQSAAAVALGRIGGPAAAQLLLQYVTDPKRPSLSRHLAAAGLGLLLDPTGGRRAHSVAHDLDWESFTPTVVEVLTEM